MTNIIDDAVRVPPPINCDKAENQTALSGIFGANKPAFPVLVKNATCTDSSDRTLGLTDKPDPSLTQKATSHSQ